MVIIESRDTETGHLSIDELLETPKYSNCTVFQIFDLAYVLKHPQLEETLVDTVARDEISCNTCASRAQIYTTLSGPNGPVFLESISKENGMLTKVPKAVRLRSLAKINCKENASSILAIDGKTFPKAISGRSPLGEDYHHWSLTPNMVSTREAYTRFKSLSHYGVTGFDSRISKLLGKEEMESVAIINSVVGDLERPDHWKSVLKWVTQLQIYFKSVSEGAESFEELNDVAKWKVRVYALMSGRVGGNSRVVHFDYQQADNIVDFIEKAVSKDALKNMMDSRSDESTYMVSSYNRALTEKGVKSECMIGLMWDGCFADDLDIHVSNEKKSFHCYYGNKNAGDCVLDFDANISHGEKDPVENVSVNPNNTYTFWVVNFTRRTYNEPIKYTIVCREKGKKDVLYEGTIDTSFPMHKPHIVFTHEFGSATVDNPELSEKAKQRNNAHDSEWNEVFGSPISTIASLEDLSPEKILYKREIKIENVDANETFKSMLNVSKPGIKRKNLLSERCRESAPETMTELVGALNSESVLEIDYREFSPGYFVNIETNKPVCEKSMPIPCHFKEKGNYPVKPTATGNSRFDASWFGGLNGRQIRVNAIVKSGGKYLMLLDGIEIPDSPEFPMGGGFYPTDLDADYHKHRERWVYFHTQLKPRPAEGTQLVGAFMVEKNVKLRLNGEDIEIERD